MPIENDIEEFKSWAIQLGCPSEFIPNEDALKFIFRSGKSQALQNFIRKVKPRDEVKTIRANILLSKIGKIDGTLSLVNSMPKEMQRFIKIKNIKEEKIRDVQKRINTWQRKYDLISNEIKGKNILKMKQQHEISALEIKVNIFEAKLNSLKNDIEKEKLNKLKLEETEKNPQQANNSRGIHGSYFLDTFKEINNDLDQFYKNNQYGEVEQALLWKRIKPKTMKITNYTFWTHLTKLKDEQLNTLRLLLDSSKAMSNLTLNESERIKEIVVKGCSSHLKICIDVQNKNKELKNILSQYVLVCEDFIGTIETKMKLLNVDCNNDDDNSIITEFITAYSSLHFNQGKCDYILKEIDNKKKEIERNFNNLDDHLNLLNNIKDIYNETNNIVQRMQNEISTSYNIKEKLFYTKGKTNYLIQNFNICNSNKTILKNSIDSFSDSSDNVLCSTKIDNTELMETTLRMDATMFTPLPAYCNEIVLFAEIPFHQLIKYSPGFNFDPNPFIIYTEKSDSIKMCPDHLLSAQGLINQINLKCQWYNKLTTLMKEITLIDDVEQLSEIDEKELKQTFLEQKDTISELLDQITVMHINANMLIKKTKKYYEFSIENPLRNFISPQRMFNGRNFKTFENEYKMYYRMVKGIQN